MFSFPELASHFIEFFHESHNTRSINYVLFTLILLSDTKAPKIGLYWYLGMDNKEMAISFNFHNRLADSLTMKKPELYS